MFITKLIYGILLFTIGVALLKYRRQIKNFTGEFVWIEMHLGRGTTYLLLILIGCICISIGVAIPFGVLDFLFQK